VPVPVLKTGATPEELSAFREALLDKYQFTRDTRLNQQAANLGLRQGAFFQLLLSGFGGNKETLPSGKIIITNRDTTKYGWKTLFKSQHPILFDEVKEQMLNNKWEFVETLPLRVGGKDPNARCKLRLTEFGVWGMWDEFSVGFPYYPHGRNAETGVIEPLMSVVRGKDGNYSQQQAVQWVGRQFVFKEEIDNIQAMREEIIRDAEQYAVPKPASTAPGGHVENPASVLPGHADGTEKPANGGGRVL